MPRMRRTRTGPPGPRSIATVASNGDVGIWHETYRVRPGDFECVYNNMPPFGLAAATRQVPATGHRESAAGRMAAGRS